MAFGTTPTQRRAPQNGDPKLEAQIKALFGSVLADSELDELILKAHENPKRAQAFVKQAYELGKAQAALTLPESALQEQLAIANAQDPSCAAILVKSASGAFILTFPKESNMHLEPFFGQTILLEDAHPFAAPDSGEPSDSENP